jgi:hypothetical protein
MSSVEKKARGKMLCDVVCDTALDDGIDGEVDLGVKRRARARRQACETVVAFGVKPSLHQSG